MCMSALGKVAPYALGGLLGGSAIKSMFSSGSNGKKKAASDPAPQVTQGTPAPAYGS